MPPFGVFCLIWHAFDEHDPIHDVEIHGELQSIGLGCKRKHDPTHGTEVHGELQNIGIGCKRKHDPLHGRLQSIGFGCKRKHDPIHGQALYGELFLMLIVFGPGQLTILEVSF